MVVITFVDTPGAATRLLRADTTLNGMFGGAVFCDEVPDGYDGPFVLVRGSAVQPTAPGVLGWDDWELLVDVVSLPLDAATARAGAGRVREVLTGARGSVAAGVVLQDVDVTGMVYIDDPTFSPSRPRWVLTVNATVRAS